MGSNRVRERAAHSKLIELAGLFLKLGTIAFGGPAAHIAMMREEVVHRKKWMDDEHFLDLLGATNLIPGPNSTEMAIHIGYTRAGWRGLIVAGISFILPAMLIVMGFAWMYRQYGALPQANWLFYGLKPVIVVIIVQALWSLGQKAVKSWLTGAVAVSVFSLYILGVNEILLLLLAGLVVMAANNREKLAHLKMGAAFLPLTGLAGAAAGSIPFQLGTLFWLFLKIGSVLFGSGYVLLAFLQRDFVERTGWLTQGQLLDAIAVGQFTPGPVFTTATFIGFLLDGTPGAIAATVGIFLPAFVVVAISSPFIPKLRRSPWAGSLLDGVNAASLALMAAVTVQLGIAALVDIPAVLLAAAAGVFILRYNANSTLLLLTGALVGIIRYLLF